MKQNIEISQENLTKAYDNASKEQKTLLENLFGKDTFQTNKPKDVRERIKTFEDALNELGEEHPLVKELRLCTDSALPSVPLFSLLKLQVITAALNEGWEPKFTENEYRWYPWYYLYTQEELDNDAQLKSRAVLRGGYSANAYSGLAYAGAYVASSYSYSVYGSRLAFKSEELAEYAGEQFKELYADWCFIPSEKK